MMKKRDNTKSKKLVWDLVEDKQVVPKNEDPDFVPTIWRHNFSKQQMKKEKEDFFSNDDKETKQSCQDFNFFKEKEKQHQNRWWSRLMIYKQFDIDNEPEGGSYTQGESVAEKEDYKIQ